MPRSVPPRRLIAIGGLLALGLAPARLLPTDAARAREMLRNDSLNRADYERMERGYYEELLDAGRNLGPTVDADSAALGRGDRDPQAFEAGPLADLSHDARQYTLKRGLSIEHWGVRWSTNSLGLRDREYAAAKPEGTFRIALLGDSITSGWGVDDGLNYESSLERAWGGRSESAGGPRLEILNFAIPGHAPGQRWEHGRIAGLPTGPDLVVYQATLADIGWDERRLRAMLTQGLGWDSPTYGPILDRIGVRKGLSPEAYKRILRPYRYEILESVYRDIVAGCRREGLPCAWILIPRVGKPDEPGERLRLLEMARQAGFSPVLDLSDAYDGLSPASLAIKPDDYHPNAGGHDRLARRIDEALWPGVAAQLKGVGR